MKNKDIINLLLKRNKIILNLIIIVLINLVGLKLHFSFDLTKNSSYSLSKISEEMVSNLADPLTIKVFFSRDLPSPYNSVSRYIADLMDEYADAGNKNFNYEMIDVEKEKDVASQYGIHPIQLREIASDQLKFRNSYMGVAIVHGDLIEKINSITESEGLEYRITTTIKKMTGKIDTLQKLEHPIKVTLFASSNLPLKGIQSLDKKVGDIVKKCSEENYNKLDYHYADSVKDNTAIKTATSFGIVKLNWPGFRNEEGKYVGPGEGVLGIVVELDNKFDAIQSLLARSLFGEPVIANLDNLKDSINKAIDNITNNNPGIGYITGHEERDLNDPNSGAGNFRELLSDMYDLKEINLEKEDIPEDISIIIVNGPKREYPDYELFKIDQFLMKGKSAFFLIDSFTEFNNPGMERFGGGRPVVLPLNPGVDKLLSHYGASVNKDIVLDKKCYKATQQGFNGQDIYFIPIIKSEGLNKDNVITRYLKTLYWSKGSSVTTDSAALKNSGIKETVLVASSGESWLMKGRIDFMPFAMAPPDDRSQMKKENLAQLLEGDFTSFFKGKEIPVNKKDDKARKAPSKESRITTTRVIEKAVKPAKVIAAGSSEITLSGIIDKEGKTMNSVFLHNAVDYLAGNYNIQEMRSKGLEFNPLKDTGENTRFIIKLINIALLPIGVICAGIIAWRKRLLRKKKIMEEFNK